MSMVSMGTGNFDTLHERKRARFPHKKNSQTLISL